MGATPVTCHFFASPVEVIENESPRLLHDLLLSTVRDEKAALVKAIQPKTEERNRTNKKPRGRIIQNRPVR